jgi:hypothetical protein
MAASISERQGPPKSLLVDQETSAVASGAQSPSGSPPTKKRRLKLNPPRPIPSPGDTIAVSRTKRLSSSRSNRRSDINGQQSEPFDGSNERTKRTTSESNTDHLNDADEDHSGPADDEDAPVATAPEDYGDFMSYYIAGNDGPDPENAKAVGTSKSRRQTNQKRKSRSDPSNPAPSAEKQQSGLDRTGDGVLTLSRPISASERKNRANPIRPSPLGLSSNMKTPQDPFVSASPGQTPRGRQIPHDSTYQAAREPYIHRRPVLQWIEIVPETQPPGPSTISEMIEKVNYLSSALAGIGGPMTQDQGPSQTGSNMETLRKGVDDQPPTDREDQDLAERTDVNLAESGSDDEPLVHGIHFIQNALRSWAQQRLTNETFHHFQMQAQQSALAAERLTAREPIEPTASAEEVVVVTCDLATTPEGVTIKAFQEVLDSGCLRMNMIIPSELSRALRRLYVQIDHLINQDQRNTMHWQCMSYNAQLVAHQKRIGIWQEARFRAQEELMKQQRMIDSQLMAQLNSTDRPATASSTAPGRPQQKHAQSLTLRKSLPNGIVRSPHEHSGLTAIRPKPHQASPVSQPSTPAAATTLHRAPNTAPIQNTKGHIKASPEAVRDGQSIVGRSLKKRPARVRLSVTKPGDSNEEPFEIYSSDAIAPRQSAGKSIATREGSNPAGSLSSDNLTAQPAKDEPALGSEEKHSSGKLPRHPLRSPVSLAGTSAGSLPKATTGPSTPVKGTRNIRLPRNTSMASTVPMKDDRPGSALAQSPKVEGTDSLSIASPQLGRSMRIRRSSRKYEESKHSET